MRQDIIKHVNDIAEKYLIPGETQDIALMFVPSESVYAELHDGFDDVVQKAYRAQVMMVSPTLLMLAIQVIQQIQKDAQMREAADQIRNEVGQLMKDVRLLGDRVKKLQKHFGQANEDIGRSSSRRTRSRSAPAGSRSWNSTVTTHRPPMSIPAPVRKVQARLSFDLGRELARTAADPRANSGMTAAADDESRPQPAWREAFAVYLKPRVLIVLFLGFSAGPAARAVRLDAGGVDARGRRRSRHHRPVHAGRHALHHQVPVGAGGRCARRAGAVALLGRRRGWLVLSQLLLIAAIVLLALCDPKISPWYMVFGAALLVAAASATQDIVIDAFRVESLDASEQAAGMASYVAAYRVGMLVSTAGALFVVTGFEDFGFGKDLAWSLGYVAMAAFVAIGIVTALLATEPARSAAIRAEHEKHAAEHPLLRVTRTAISAFSEFLTREMALVALVFVILYKFCDAFAGAMTTPFVIDLGFSRNDYAAIVKGVGLAATLIGGFAGGFVARAYPLATSLWIGGFLQMASNLVFTWLALVGHSYWALTAAIIAENFTGAIGTVIFVAYLSALCQSPLHTATQYALLTALVGGRPHLPVVGRGLRRRGHRLVLVLHVSALAALPSLALLWWLQARGHFDGLGPEGHGPTTDCDSTSLNRFASRVPLPRGPGCSAGIQTEWIEARAACGSASPPTACPRRDSRARRRPARHARAASP